MMFNQPPPSPLSHCSPQGPPAPSLAHAVPGILQPPRILTIQALAAAAMANRHPSDDWVCQVCGNFNRAVRERCNMNVCAAPFGFPGPYKWIAPSTTSTSPARPQHHFNNTAAAPAMTPPTTTTTTTTATATNVPLTTTAVPMPTHTGASGSGLTTHTGTSGSGLTQTGVSGSGLTTGTGSSGGGFMTPSCGHSPPTTLTPSTSRTSAHTVAATTATAAAAAAAAAAFVATPNTAASTPHSTTASATMMSVPTAMCATTSPLTYSTSTDPAAFPSAGAGAGAGPGAGAGAGPGAGAGAGARNTPPMLSPWGRQDASGSWNSAPVKAEASLDDRFSLSAKSGAPPSTSSEPAQPAQPLTQPLSSNSTATPAVSCVLPPPAVKATSAPGAPEGWVYVPAHTLQHQGVVPLPACTSLPHFAAQQSTAMAPASSTPVTAAATPASAQPTPYMMVHPSHMVYLVPQPQQQ